MKEALKSIWENLTNEQKEKWKACKSEEEFLAFVDNEGIRLPDNVEGEVTDDEAAAVAGGKDIPDVWTLTHRRYCHQPNIALKNFTKKLPALRSCKMS